MTNTKFYLKILILFLIIISFFTGFYFKDFVPGGAAGDFEAITWPLLQSFKKDFYYSITNYGSFKEGSYPLFYIINSYLNPFSSNKIHFVLSVTSLSFFLFIVFAILLKKNFPKINILDCYLTSSIILLLPFFRSSAYGGTTENFGWFFFIISIYFFNKIRFSLERSEKVKFIILIGFCFFSSCGLYIRPALVFLPISYFFYLFLNSNDKKVIFNSIIYFFIFSLPGLSLILLWGGLYDSNNFNVKMTEDFHNYKFILKNIPILLSYFAFYFLPLLVVEYIDIGIKKFIHKYLLSFLFSLIILAVLAQFNLLNYLGKFTFGGGAILKLNYVLKPENYFILIIFSSIGFAALYKMIKENFKINICFILPIFIIYGLPKEIYQEYSEPLILIIFFFGIIQTRLHEIYFRNIFVSNTVAVLYFSIYLLGATYYKHFM